MSPVVWVAALFLVGIGVIVLEVFVPSGGVLGFVSGGHDEHRGDELLSASCGPGGGVLVGCGS